MNTTRPFLGKEVPFHEAYPNVEQLTLDIEQHGEIESEWQRTQSFNQANLPSVIPCSNSRCQQGGFSLKTLIYFMIESKKTEKEETIFCEGHEGSPKGRRKGDPCDNYIKLKVKIWYKNSD